MKYYNLIILTLLFFGNYSYSMEFKVAPSDNFDGVIYYTLQFVCGFFTGREI